MAARAKHHGTFGEDTFGRFAERTARFFGTPQYIIGQTIVVAAWITFNVVAVRHAWDPTPFIMLNLVFSTQAAYAAPLILLAQTRQAERDKAHDELVERHHEQTQHTAARREAAIKEATDALAALLHSNTDLTQQDKDLTERVHRLTQEIHARLADRPRS